MRLYGRIGKDGDYNELIEEIALTPKVLNFKPDEQVFYIDIPENKSFSIWLDFEEDWKPYLGVFRTYEHSDNNETEIISEYQNGKLINRTVNE